MVLGRGVVPALSNSPVCLPNRLIFMSSIDWIVLTVTLSFIILYGIYKHRNDKTLDGYLLGNKSLPWYHVGFSVMATQASAITFLSAPGQGFSSGMGFVQFYFGLPLAMIVLSITFIPIFHRLRVYTAYEFLEERFGPRVRVFTSFLFLLQRGLSTGISIYAPSIILSTIFQWDIWITNIFMGGIVLTYSIVGGTKAISYTHLQQMMIVLTSLVVTGFMIMKLLPQDMSFYEALQIAGKSDRMKIIDWEFNPRERYNIWSGLLGGFFLQLSYFGTDQSQVGRYITGSSIEQSRLGLLMNGLLKIPMQLGILLLGVLVFVYYQFNTPPLFFNDSLVKSLEKTTYASQIKPLEETHAALSRENQAAMYSLREAVSSGSEDQVGQAQAKIATIRTQLNEVKNEFISIAKKALPSSDTTEVNYVFLRFILDHLPMGLIGLLIAVIFSASMGSIASAYNSLAACSVIDIYRKVRTETPTDHQEVKASRWATFIWGLFCIIVAQFAHLLGSSMIELVNILGSWFYGVILGIFLAAFYVKSLQGKAVFYGAIVAQIAVIFLWYWDVVAFLWLNPIGCGLVIGLSSLFQLVIPHENTHRRG